MAAGRHFSLLIGEPNPTPTPTPNPNPSPNPNPNPNPTPNPSPSPNVSLLLGERVPLMATSDAAVIIHGHV